MLEEFFKFPIVLIDGDNEERKEIEKERYKALTNKEVEDESEDYDIVYAEAEYPYWDFLGIEDRWIPTNESFQKAISQNFEACLVRFANVGHLLVPWTKKKFKKEIQKFAEEYELKHPKEKKKKKQLRILSLSPEQADKIMKDGEG